MSGTDLGQILYTCSKSLISLIKLDVFFIEVDSPLGRRRRKRSGSNITQW